jgi:hypothetical protein
MWKNTVDSSTTQMTIWHMHIVCWILKATNTLTISNTYCLSTEWMVARMCLIVMLYVHCLSCWSYRTQLFLEWEMFQTKVVEKIRTHILCYVTLFFKKWWCLWDNVEKWCTAVQATDDNMAHAYCMLAT